MTFHHPNWQRLRTLFDSQKLAVLATLQDAAKPHASLVAYLVMPDFRRLVFATDRQTRKYNHVQNRPDVAVLIDNRSADERDFQVAMAVTAFGRAFEIQGDDRQPHQEAFLARHPALESFVQSPTCALMAVEISRYSLVDGLADLTELVPDQEP